VSIRLGAAGIAAAGLVASLAVPASAQQTSPPKSAAAATASRLEWGKGDIEGGADIGMRVLNRGETTTYEKGFFLGASLRANDFVSVIVQYTGDYDKQTSFTANRYTYGGGARFNLMPGKRRVTPFAQIVLAGGQDNGTGDGIVNHYAVVDPGGGVDIAINQTLSFRSRLDFPLFATFGDVFKGLRGQLGLSVGFGNK